jgi:hypothetical protein
MAGVYGWADCANKRKSGVMAVPVKSSASGFCDFSSARQLNREDSPSKRKRQDMNMNSVRSTVFSGVTSGMGHDGGTGRLPEQETRQR